MDVSVGETDWEGEELGRVGGDEPCQPPASPPEHPSDGPDPVEAGIHDVRHEEPTPHQRHGYATIEVHRGAANVIRWEYLDDGGGNTQPGPESVLKQREWFELAEWLATLPINNRERAQYFELERVSLSY